MCGPEADEWGDGAVHGPDWYAAEEAAADAALARQEPAVWKCVVCHWFVDLDDVQLSGSHGGCVCIRCYARLVENEKPLSKELRRELEIVTNGAA